jgi:hypothetical protein
LEGKVGGGGLAEKKQQITVDCQFDLHILIFIPQNFDNSLFMKLKIRENI